MLPFPTQERGWEQGVLVVSRPDMPQPIFEENPEIKAVVKRFFQALDADDWATLSNLFARDEGLRYIDTDSKRQQFLDAQKEVRDIAARGYIIETPECARNAPSRM